MTTTERSIVAGPFEGGEVFVGKESDIEEKTIMVTVQREEVVITLAGGKTIRLPIMAPVQTHLLPDSDA